MKCHGVIIVLCSALFYGGAIRAAELLGSPDPEIRKNFNRLLTTNACPRCDLRGVVLNRIDLFGADLSGANLAGAQLGHACLVGASLRRANLRGAWLGGADLSGTDMTGADLEGVNFTLNSGIPELAEDDDSSLTGRQAAAAATTTVNSTLNELFSRLPENPPATTAPAQDPSALPPLNGMPWAAAPTPDQPRRSVDEIPVIEPIPVQPPKRAQASPFWERIWSKQREKRENEDGKGAPVDGSRQQIPAARESSLVIAPPPDDESLGATVAIQPPQSAVR